MPRTYVEVLKDGLTLGGAVRRAGAVVAVDDFTAASKKDQVARWGEPRYKEVSKKEFDERGGVLGESLGSAVRQFEPQPLEDDPTGEEFSDLKGKSVDDTLSAVAEFDDAGTQRFVAWEQANANRKGVLEPLGAWTE